MSDSVAGVRRKIDSAGDLQSVVRTMKALAASNIGQYERSLRALSDYYRTVELGLSACFRESEPAGSVAGRDRSCDDARAAAAVVERSGRKDAKVVGAVVFGSDQGLVGQFNELVADEAMRFLGALGGKADVWAVGERVHSRLANGGLLMTGLFTVPNSVRAIAPLVGQILVESEARDGRREVAELHLFYNRPTSGAGYTTVHRRLLPLDGDWRRELIELPWPTANLPQLVSCGTATLRALVREYLFVSLFRACAESLASENASRLAAMDRADKNINELLENLHRLSHRLRQSGIDEELFDVISGFEALSKPLGSGAHLARERK
jgi:F-type H+-transporting ATPase subunit gamma